MSETTSLLLIDGNNLGWRAYGQAPLSYMGQRTEVIKIGLIMLRSYMELFCPDRTIVVWDGGHDISRTSVYPEYKRRDKEQTEAEKKESALFFDQVHRLQDCITKLGIDQVLVRRREADDVIFSLLNPALRGEEQAFIISTDEDMFQLVAHYPDVAVYSPIKQILYTKDEIEAKLGFPVDYYLQYKALVGDPSDNLPGVRGIGPQKARIVVEYLRTGAPAGWDEKHKKLKETWDAQYELYKKMLDLVEFRTIPKTEIAEGSIPGTDEDISVTIYEIANQYGFDQVLENVGRFMGPFLTFQNRSKA